MSGITFHRISPGEGNCFASKCFRDNFIGVDFLEEFDLADIVNAVPKDKNAFTQSCKQLPDSLDPSENTGRGNAATVLYTVFCEINQGDFIVCPDDCGNYAVGKVVGDYYYVEEDANFTEREAKSIKNKPNRILPHRRKVEWMLDKGLPGRHLEIGLRNQLGIPRTISYLGEVGGGENGRYGNYIKSILDDVDFSFAKIYTDYIADSEKNLEAYLSENWKDFANIGSLNTFRLVEKTQDTDLLKKLNIHISDKDDKAKEGDKNVGPGRQMKTSVGVIDLLAYSKEQKQLLVIELKMKQGSDETVGQVLRYMGYLRQEVKKAKCDIKVKGCIITYGENQNILCALECVEDVDYYRYEACNKDLSDLKLVKD